MVKEGETKNITLRIQTGKVAAYPTCREFVASCLYQLGKPQKAVAGDMDYAPTTLSRKLAQNPDDSQRFTLDDLETYVETQGDTAPIYYLVEKYLLKHDKEAIRRQIEDLKAMLEEG